MSWMRPDRCPGKDTAWERQLRGKRRRRGYENRLNSSVWWEDTSGRDDRIMFRWGGWVTVVVLIRWRSARWWSPVRTGYGVSRLRFGEGDENPLLWD